MVGACRSTLATHAPCVAIEASIGETHQDGVLTGKVTGKVSTVHRRMITHSELQQGRSCIVDAKYLAKLLQHDKL